MKVQIRQSTFETNSSSTHSLIIKKTSLDNMKDVVNKRIIEQYNQDLYGCLLNHDDFIEGTEFCIKGFDIYRGDESKNIYYIITDWVVKLQYIGMLLYSYMFQLKDYNDNEYEVHINKFLDTDMAKWLINFVIEQAKLRNIDINKVYYDVHYDTYIEHINNDNENKFWHYPLDEDKFKNMCAEIMDDEYIVTYCDEAYRPYEAPEIIIL